MVNGYVGKTVGFGFGKFTVGYVVDFIKQHGTAVVYLAFATDNAG